jgi:hypothetical protein
MKVFLFYTDVGISVGYLLLCFAAHHGDEKPVHVSSSVFYMGDPAAIYLNPRSPTYSSHTWLHVLSRSTNRETIWEMPVYGFPTAAARLRLIAPSRSPQRWVSASGLRS